MHSLAALHICTSAGHVLGFSNVRTTSPRRSPAEFTRYAPQPLHASIRVYDNVAPTDTCRRLHKLTLESTQRGTDGSFVFHRGTSKHKPSRLTPIETAIDQILTSLDDTSPIVEYWSRSEYINLDAHADIDENTLKEDGVLRCPRHGHVLYMQIATDPIIRVGPTVVFPERKVAWGTVTPRTLPSPNAASYNSQANVEERAVEYIVDVENYWDDEQKRQYGYEIDAQSVPKDEMAIVPAVTGRLLRFDGSAFHAVPKPPDRYLLSEKELIAYLDKECEEDCDDEDSYWDDDYDEYDDGDEEEDEEDKPNRRSVLLFNTWPEGSGGPRGVDTDTVVLEVPDGIEIDDGDVADNGSSLEEERWSKWQDAYGDQFEGVECNPFEEWTAMEVEAPSTDAVRDVTVPLMGNPARRGVADTKDVLTGVIESALFYDSRKVSLVTLGKKDID